MKKIKIYLANGLFVTGDRLLNEVIYKELIKIKGIDVYAPQFNLAINDKTKPAGSKPIYDGDTDRVAKCDILIAVLDDHDLGVATEVGWVAGFNACNPKSKHKLILGLYTDIRDASTNMCPAINKDIKKNGLAESQYAYINLYLIGAIKKYGKVFNDYKKLIAYIKKLAE